MGERGKNYGELVSKYVYLHASFPNHNNEFCGIKFSDTEKYHNPLDVVSKHVLLLLVPS